MIDSVILIPNKKKRGKKKGNSKIHQNRLLRNICFHLGRVIVGGTWTGSAVRRAWLVAKVEKECVQVRADLVLILEGFLIHYFNNITIT